MTSTTAATVTRKYANNELATAMAIKLGLSGRPFSFGKTPRGKYTITVAAEDEALIADKPKPTYCVVQEGGSSTEFYLHAHLTLREAEEDRVNCAEGGAYNTSPVIEIPAVTAALGELFYEYAEKLVAATTQMDYGD